MDARRVKGVLASVSRDAQLGQAKHADLALLRRFDRALDAIAVAVPIQGCLVENSGAEFNQFHELSARMLKIRASFKTGFESL